MFINDFIKTNQEGTQVYLFAAPVKDVLNHYTVESHDVRKNPTGYMGKMNYDSYTERANQILELGVSYFVSKPIIAAINRRDMADYETSLELQNNMRIVDGHIEVMGLSTVLEEHNDSDFGELLRKKTV
ncbi:hypothetical protein, partial [Bacillus mycoides]|uniref:hypothetical protein n=1 Tax=Bacillus mycoides TaxID=1405 RepID=UPI003A7FF79D